MDDETTVIGDDDRLSTLPNDVLTTILSFLGANEVVQTCLLSKRWHDLWTFVPCLNFSDSNCEVNGEFKPGDLEKFQNFVSSFLELRDNATDLQTFMLRHKMSHDSMSWVSYAVMHNVQNLQLEFYGEEYMDLPDCIFTCESLQDVYLGLVYRDAYWGILYEEDPTFIVPDMVSLPKLKKLHVLWKCMRGDYMARLFAGCPALESLKLDCEIMEMTNNISFPSLKRLCLLYCCFNSELAPSSFHISAPCLEYLEYDGHMGYAAKFKDMCKVKKAKFAIHLDDEEFYNCELFSSFSSIEDLSIESYCLLEQMSREELPKCPTFHNLKNLTLESCCMYCGFGQLCNFLKHCPNLEILTLFHTEGICQERVHEEKQMNENLQEIERFGCDQLRLINVVYTDWDVIVDRLIRLLVQSTKGMDFVKINMRKTPN